MLLESESLAVPETALCYGLTNDFSAVSTSRTIMLPDAQSLFRIVPSYAGLADYQAAVVDENALGKPTASTRKRTFAFLRDRYGLDQKRPVFAAFRALWDDDPRAQPLLALLITMARDPVLRATAKAVIDTPEGAPIHWEHLASAIAQSFPRKLTAKTLRSTAQNAAASWGQSGHIRGRVSKRRIRPEVLPTNAAYALLLGHLCGGLGDALFNTQWTHALDVPQHRLRDLAAAASRRGWIDYRHAGSVTEVGFSHLLPSDRMSR